MTNDIVRIYTLPYRSCWIQLVSIIRGRGKGKRKKRAYRVNPFHSVFGRVGLFIYELIVRRTIIDVRILAASFACFLRVTVLTSLS